MALTQKYSLQYQGMKVIILYPRPIRQGICQGCQRSIERNEIKTTQLHHTYYAYKNETVKKNPYKALENTLELCFPCHECADSLRTLTVMSPERVTEIFRLLPPEQKARITRICKLILSDSETKDLNIGKTIKAKGESKE